CDREPGKGLCPKVKPSKGGFRFSGGCPPGGLGGLRWFEEHPLYRETTFQLGSFGHGRYGDFGYNPPEAVREIDDALAGIELDHFVRHMPKSQQLAEELDNARQDFALLRRVYWLPRPHRAGGGSGVLFAAAPRGALEAQLVE